MELVGYAEAAWGVEEASVARADDAHKMLGRLLDSSVAAVEAARQESDPAADAAAPYINATERDRVLALHQSLLDSGEIQGAIAFATGKAVQLLAFEEFPNPWLKADRGRPLEAIRKGILKLLGEPTTEQTATRLDALDTIHWSLAELLSG
jgi:hypothetical protein